MKLSDRNWMPFTIGSIFEIYTGGDMIISRLEPGNYPLISHSLENNGIAKYIAKQEGIMLFNHKKSLSLADRGNFGALVQKQDFYIGTRVKALVVKNKYSITYEALHFLAKCITIQSVRFNYGNNCTGGAEHTRFMLPINSKGEPDFQFMAAFIKELIDKKVSQYKAYTEEILEEVKCNVDFGSKKWDSFIISDIFDIKPGKRLVAADSTEGKRPFIGALDNSNGVARFVSDDNASKDKNVLGVNYNGNGMVIGFYHPYECIFSDDVKRFHLKHYPDNEYVLLFMKALILKQKSKFGYLYKFNAERMAHTSIMMPVDAEGNPDYAFMEQYGKMLVARKYQQYLDYLDSQKIK